MAQLTTDYIRDLAKKCGFTFTVKKSGEYSLVTTYNRYTPNNLKNAEMIIIRDNRRFTMER